MQAPNVWLLGNELRYSLGRWLGGNQRRYKQNAQEKSLRPSREPNQDSPNLQQIESLWIKPIDALNSNFIGITILHVSNSLSVHHQEFLAVYRLWYILRKFWWPVATRSRMELSSILLLVANGHNCIKCTKADVRLRTPDDGQKGCSKHVES